MTARAAPKFADVDRDEPSQLRRDEQHASEPTLKPALETGDGRSAGNTTATHDAVPSVSQAGMSVRLEQLRAFYGEAEQVKGIDLEFRANEVTAIIGPSGCGKSTMVRCINRMHEEIPGARAEGRVLLDGLDVYGPSVDVVSVRRAIGIRSNMRKRNSASAYMAEANAVARTMRFTGATGFTSAAVSAAAPRTTSCPQRQSATGRRCTGAVTKSQTKTRDIVTISRKA